MTTEPEYTAQELKSQKYEAIYLAALVLGGAAVLATIYFSLFPGLSVYDKRYMYSIVGGFFGGLALDIKWFYRVTARGKHNQHGCRWESHKIYWRIFVPFLSAIVAFAFYTLAASGFVQVLTVQGLSGAGAFGLSFLFGYFSDGTIAKMGELVDCLWGNTKDSDKNDG
ncbi:MAG: hypothetical protein RLN82_08650 [Pseudomonadales bacterium]